MNGNADALVTHNVCDFQSAARSFDLRALLTDELPKELPMVAIAYRR